jgi:hydrogenase nickel incorporation protein HypA/HybF
MHELSIAVSLVETVCEELDRLGSVRVEVVHLRIGPLSGIVKEPLMFSFALAAEGTPLAGARLAIEEVPLVVFCPRCGEERELPSVQSFRCPVCQEPAPNVIRGKELELTALEVTDHAAPDH